MAINASYLVAVTPRTITGGSADLETNGLVLTKSALIPVGRPAIEFTSATAVSEMFGANSGEYAFAQQYFTGLTNQQRAPKCLVIARRVDEAASAWIRSGALGMTLAQVKALTVTLSITVDGTAKTATSVALSSATSFSNAAEIIATALTGVTGSYNSELDAFIFTSATTGASSTIAFATGDGATSLKLTEATGAVLSQGSAALSVAENMQKIEQVTRNWTQFTTLWEETTQSEVEAYSAFADVADDYAYVFWSSDHNMVSTLTQSSTIAAAIKGQYNCTLPIYCEYPATAAFALAYPATIKWDANQGMKVLFGKTASGIAPLVQNETEAAALDDLYVSYVGLFATRNAEFTLANRGHLTSDMYGFYDTLIGIIWFKAYIQRAIMDGFASVNRVPYNEKGFNIIAAWVQDPINAAKNVGVIDVGVELSNAQKAQIQQEVGKDISGDLFSVGYYLTITAPTANVRAQRGSPVMALYFTYAGSVQKAELPVTAIL